MAQHDSTTASSVASTVIISFSPTNAIGGLSSHLQAQAIIATTTPKESFLDDQDVLSVHISFAVITLLYIPFILVNNNLVLWSTILFRKLHTPNNLMLASLAIADLIMGVYCIPIYALSYIPSTQHLVKSSGKYACLAWFASIELGGAGSLKNLLLISIDRFIAVVFPLSYNKFMTMKRAIIALVVLWAYVIIMTIVPFMGWNNYDVSIKDENTRCNYYLTLPEGYVIWASFFTIAVSILIPLLLNIKIFYTMCKQQKSIRMYQHLWSDKQIRRFKDRVQTVRITGVLCLLFIVFWLPYVLVAPLKYTSLSAKDIEIIKVIVQLLYFLNSVVNAPIYALMRKEYKIAYYLLLTTPLCKWKTLRRHPLVPDMLPPSHLSNNKHDDEPTYEGAVKLSSRAVTLTPGTSRRNTIVTADSMQLSSNADHKPKQSIDGANLDCLTEQATENSSQILEKTDMKNNENDSELSAVKVHSNTTDQEVPEANVNREENKGQRMSIPNKNDCRLTLSPLLILHKQTQPDLGCKTTILQVDIERGSTKVTHSALKCVKFAKGKISPLPVSPENESIYQTEICMQNMTDPYDETASTYQGGDNNKTNKAKNHLKHCKHDGDNAHESLTLDKSNSTQMINGRVNHDKPIETNIQCLQQVDSIHTELDTRKARTDENRSEISPFDSNKKIHCSPELHTHTEYSKDNLKKTSEECSRSTTWV